jgi:hypothetical protein
LIPGTCLAATWAPRDHVMSAWMISGTLGPLPRRFVFTARFAYESPHKFHARLRIAASSHDTAPADRPRDREKILIDLQDRLVIKNR